MNWRRLPVVRHPCADLLIVQLLGILVYPFLGDQPLGRAIFSIFGLFVLVLAVMAVRMTPALNWISAILGLPVVVLTLWEAISPGTETVVLWSSVFHAAFYFYTAFALLRYMFDDHVVTTDELYATGATFTVVAWGFAYVYLAVAIVWPDSFSVVQDPLHAKAWFEMLYLSVTTMTSLGMSDIIPIRSQARAVGMLEQIAGMLYIALAVARMIALTVPRTAAREQRQRKSSD
ncbi:two pore domain potassium channel family protein [Nocardioides piscis]|uniref:Two pore domain potassium channel family protein n=1 Tax=Nocardioides piscis TaxID=2714938 RepID=A0A6G7YKW7_9ACTN|nr:two pore domain potassium channel family protein [Nocardioides piscis]